MGLDNDSSYPLLNFKEIINILLKKKKLINKYKNEFYIILYQLNVSMLIPQKHLSLPRA
jgi:hypothetical protein